jgi:voltage-gated potassium channel
MVNKTALIFGLNKYAFEIALNAKTKYKNIQIYSLHDVKIENTLYKIEHFDLSDEWSDIENSIDIENSVAFCVLEDSAENIFLTISLRAHFEKLTIIAIASNQESANKLKMAGANKVIPLVETTADIITNILEKPISNKVLNSILYEESNLKIAQVKIQNEAYFEGEKLFNIDWGSHKGIIILSLMHEDLSHEFIYSSKVKHHVIKNGDVLVVIGYDRDIKEFKKEIGS